MRLTVRRLMLALAIATVFSCALACSVGRHRRARHEAWMAVCAANNIKGQEGRDLAALHARASGEYARAAFYPWLPGPRKPE